MKILFAGTPEFAAGFLKSLIKSEHSVIGVITQPDRPGKRGKKLQESPVKKLAREAKLEVIQPKKLSLTDIDHLYCDLMIVVAFGQILKTDVLTHPKMGCINVHGSLLPKWRGAAPIQRAILSGDEKSGITLIQMNEGLDTGDMLGKAEITIFPDDNTGDLFKKFSDIGQTLLIETLELLEDGSEKREPQNNNDASYAHKTLKSEALLKWRLGARQVDRLVRGFNPEPIAFCFLDNYRIKIYEGRVVQSSSSRPGEIIELSSDGLLVSCGQDAYLITKLQLPLGKGVVLSASDMMNGWSDILAKGAVFAETANE